VAVRARDGFRRSSRMAVDGDVHYRRLAMFASSAVAISAEAIASLYKKSFDAFPGLTVDVKAIFAGRGAHCFEYSAVLSDAAGVPATLAVLAAVIFCTLPLAHWLRSAIEPTPV